MRGLFITGTGTGVGKTVTSALLLRHFRGVVPLRYWKPIQTGIEQDDDTAEVRRLAECSADEIFDSGVRLREPVSPHLAARLARFHIDVKALRDSAPVDDRRWIVEGAGGVLVPVNESELMIDFMALLGLPVVIVAQTALGTINHTLLTIQAVRARGLTVAGVVMNGEPNHSNREAIETYGVVNVVGEIPQLSPLNTYAPGVFFDPRLLEFLR